MSTAAAPPPLAPSVHIGPPRAVVPGPGLAPEVVVDSTNDDLDLAHHDGTLFLAWRTAPTHAASTRARIQVIASDDGGTTWRLDYSVVAKRDLRAPRLVSWQGRLLLYWATAGTKGRSIEPDRIWVTERAGDAAWRQPVALSPAPCSLWRVRPIGERLAMTVHRGTGQRHAEQPAALSVELWGSDDGTTWAPFDAAHPVVHRGGVAAEVLALRDGRVAAIVRKQGPEGGWGSDVAVAPADDPTHWICRPDDRALDAPWLFLDDDRPMLLARRPRGFGGRDDALGLVEDRLDLELPVDPHLRAKVDLGLTALAPATLSIHAVDPDARVVRTIGDLPFRGDGATAATVPVGRHHLCLGSTTAPAHGGWPSVVGRFGRTTIAAVELQIRP